jgi:ankyrin repeat protein
LAFTINLSAQEIFDAVRKGDLAKVKELVKKDSQLVNARNAREYTPLHAAAEIDDEEITRYLIERGADINAVNPSTFFTPLMFAGIKTTKILVENGVDLNFEALNGRSAISYAISNRKIEVIDYLLEHGLKIPELGSQRFESMLMGALRIGNIKYLDKCIEMGLSPHFVSETKSNLLHYAAESNSEELIKKVIDFSVSVNKANIFGWTPLHAASFYGNISLVELLLKQGLDKNARTVDGCTPFNLACEAKKTDMINYLISIGADQSPQKFPVLRGEYLGQHRPGNKAEPFVLISSRDNFHTNIVFAPDGKEAFWPAGVRKIFTSKKIDGKWTMPDTVKTMPEADAPFISPDGNKLFFLGRRETQGVRKELIFVSDKTPHSWSEPYLLPDIINSIPGIHWQVSVDLTGNLYFGARQNGTVISRIYCSKFINGSFTIPQIMEPLKEVDAHSPFISPSGDYLIFTSYSKLHIIFRKKDGTWTKERIIDQIADINPRQCSIVTPDGKFLFFLKNVGGTEWRPYWVDASFIEDLRKEALKDDI